MKNLILLFSLGILLGTTSCMKNELVGPPAPPQPTEWEPDVRAKFVQSLGKIQPDSITRVGGFQVVNPNSTSSGVSSRQVIYTLTLNIENPQLIDSIYYLVGDYTNKGAVKSSSNLTLTLNQTLGNGQSSVMIQIFVKRDSSNTKTGLLEISPASIKCNFQGNTEEITPASKDLNTISLEVN